MFNTVTAKRTAYFQIQNWTKLEASVTAAYVVEVCRIFKVARDSNKSQHNTKATQVWTKFITLVGLPIFKIYWDISQGKFIFF